MPTSSTLAKKKPCIDKAMTHKQEHIFQFIARQLLLHSKSPSLREIKQEFGFGSVNAVVSHLMSIKRRGLIVSDRHNESRGLSITKPMIAVHEGRVYTCGGPSKKDVLKAIKQSGK